MKVGLDLDGVVYWFTKAANEAIMTRGYPDIGEWQGWNHGKEFVTDEDWRWLWNQGTSIVFRADGPAYQGAQGFMRRLALEHELIICTHRPKRVAPATYAWIAATRCQAGEVHVLDHNIPKSTVWDVCDVCIDDKPETCDDLLGNTGAHVFCPRRDWNRDYEQPYGAVGASRFHWYDDYKEVEAWLSK